MANDRKIWKVKLLNNNIYILLILSVLTFWLYKKKWDSEENIYFGVQDEFTMEKDVLDESDKSNMAFKGKRIVHLDLKGAPPKISYFTWFFPFIKKLGATGILIEYEDMFPYTSIDVSAKNAYTRNEVVQILKTANESSLEIIPLIQTFGHMEFVLKLEKYMDLRENRMYPQAICPSKEESLNVLKSMIDDVMEVHKGYIKYLHIGCDEVSQIGECNDCNFKFLSHKWTSADLFLNHVTTLANYIRTQFTGITPLIWDDQIRPIPVEVLNHWKIGNLIEPVVWKYTQNIKNDLPPQIWEKYSQIFPNVWFGSAFKGANLPDSLLSPVNLYFDNHRSWKSLISKYSDMINFKGGILTGWQRFDHFSVLCELLPVSIPSLAVNLIYLSTKIKTLSRLSTRAQKITGCSILAPLEYGGKPCFFPGSALHQEISKLSQIIYRIEIAKNQSTYKGWMTKYNLDKSFSNPAHVEEGSHDFLNLYMEIKNLQASLEISMEEIYTNDTIKEWISVYLDPHKNELKAIIDGRDKILSVEHWPKRPIG